jgi:hypothetical protein
MVMGKKGTSIRELLQATEGERLEIEPSGTRGERQHFSRFIFGSESMAW